MTGRLGPLPSFQWRADPCCIVAVGAGNSIHDTTGRRLHCVARRCTRLSAGSAGYWRDTDSLSHELTAGLGALEAGHLRPQVCQLLLQSSAVRPLLPQGRVQLVHTGEQQADLLQQGCALRIRDQAGGRAGRSRARPGRRLIVKAVAHVRGGRGTVYRPGLEARKRRRERVSGLVASLRRRARRAGSGVCTSQRPTAAQTPMHVARAPQISKLHLERDGLGQGCHGCARATSRAASQVLARYAGTFLQQFGRSQGEKNICAAHRRACCVASWRGLVRPKPLGRALHGPPAD